LLLRGFLAVSLSKILALILKLMIPIQAIINAAVAIQLPFLVQHPRIEFLSNWDCDTEIEERKHINLVSKPQSNSQIQNQRFHSTEEGSRVKVFTFLRFQPVRSE
jgi:hypothetical protein